MEIKNRLIFFQDQMKEHFSFLKCYGFSLAKEDIGRRYNENDYFCEFTFSNGDTFVKVHFSTDIINGIKISFPNLNGNELPSIDSQITCSIWDKNAFMSIHNYIETKFPELINDNFKIRLDATDLKSEIIKVLKNYSNFFKTNLTTVLEKKVIYDCYLNQFYENIFREIRYFE